MILRNSAESGSDDYRDLELDDEQALEFRWKAWRA